MFVEADGELVLSPEQPFIQLDTSTCVVIKG